MRRARWAAAGAALAAAAYIGADIADVAPGWLTTDAPTAAATGAPAPAPSSGVPAPPSPGATTGAAARLGPAEPSELPLPSAGTAAPAPGAAALAARLAPLLADPALGPGASAVVRDGRTGAVLYDAGGAQPRTPASTTKLITAAAIATSTPIGDGLETSVVRGSDPARLVLLAGGDTLLGPGAGAPTQVVGHAGLGDLADQVAAALRRDGLTSVTLSLDEGPYAGPRIDPAWEPGDVAAGYAGPVSPLALATMRPAPGHDVPSDPALATAQALRAALIARGVAVPRPVERAAAPAEARTVASVRSAPLADQLALALADSDNTLTSALARVAAVRSGRAAGFAQVSAWVAERAARIAPADGLVVADPSGLAPGTRATTGLLAALLAHATTGGSAELARVYADLPVAGLDGTLAGRYLSGPQRAGAGLVRAKTGTLTGVSSLAGTVVDSDGRLLVFAVAADRVPPSGTLEARAALDRFAAALAGCGCR